MRLAVAVAAVLAAAACGSDAGGGGAVDAGFDGGDGTRDAAMVDGGGGGADAAGAVDASAGSDGGAVDAMSAPVDAMPAPPDAMPAPPDAMPAPPDAMPAPPDAAPPVGVITGGPCISGAAGATAYRVRWQNGGGTAYPGYEVNGLPDTSRDHTGAYGYTIGFTPQYVDTFLAEGGLLLNSSSFVDIEISTVGVSTIESATLSIYGRSYNTTTSGSFAWQTFDGAGAAPTNLVSNVAPYAWYSADMTTEISPGDDGVLLRIYAGPSSNSLAVHRIELCMVAE